MSLIPQTLYIHLKKKENFIPENQSILKQHSGICS